jgi:sarcosine oxidase subunit delta
MLRIRCPWCGERDETEFRYRGDASRSRPAADAGLEAFAAYVYERDNPYGWHLEWWLHVGGCRRLLKLVRHTVSHRIHAVGAPEDPLSPPPGPAA